MYGVSCWKPIIALVFWLLQLSSTPHLQHIKNNKDTNKYEGWPEVVEMEGCIPQKLDWRHRQMDIYSAKGHWRGNALSAAVG